MNNKICIIDYEAGNLRSIKYKLEKQKIPCIISNKKNDILESDLMIIPGVGHFGKSIQKFKDLDIFNLIKEKVLEKHTPLMGICLGMQLLTEYSEEGDSEGFGFINARTKKFDFSESVNKLKVPNVGWNTINVRNNTYFDNIPSEKEYYFTHSYFVDPADTEQIAATSIYGHEFVSAVQKYNIFGTQFHPEKSHRKGFEIILNFIKQNIHV